jgi:DNA polymerase III subunit delta
MGQSLQGQKAVRYAKRPDAGDRLFLICCDDEGIGDAALGDLLASLKLDGESPARQRLDEDTIKDPSALSDALLSRPLIGPSTLLFFRLPNERLSQAIQKGLTLVRKNAGADHNPLVLLTGKLKKTSSLRKFIEGLDAAVVLDLPEGSASDIAELARERLSAEGASAEDDAIAALASALTGQRMLAEAEIEKLCLYARGIDRPLTQADVERLSAVESDAALHEFTRAVTGGDTSGAVAALERLLISGTQPFGLVRALDREFSRLLDAHGRIGAGANGKSVGRQLSPPVFDWAWANFERQLKAWPPRRAANALQLISDTEARLRTAGHLGEALVSRLAVQLSAAAKV